MSFAKEPERSGTPEDELLRQFQGMIAEYERAQIAERCRRGKLHRARAGAVSVMARAPYGYRYVKRSEHADAFFEIDETEAPVVREIFRRYLEEGESIAKIARWLTAQGVPTRTGADGLEQRHALGDAAQPGLRRAGRLRQDARDRRARPRHASSAPARAALRPDLARGVAPEEWKQIAVPALVTDEQFALVGQRLERNRVHLAAEHQAPVAAAGDPRLPPLRLRLLPLLDAQQERQAARVLPLLGHRRAPPSRRPRLRQPAGPPRRDRRARLELGCSDCSRTPR